MERWRDGASQRAAKIDVDAIGQAQVMMERWRWQC